MALRLFVFMSVGLVFLFSGMADAADNCDVARDVAERAASAYKKNKKRGIDLFLKAYRLCPDDGAFAYNAGMACYGDGDLARARKYLEMAVQKDGTRALWHNNLASVLLERGDNMKSALSHAQKAAGLDPDSPEILETLANAHAAVGDYPGGIAVMKKAAKRWPQNSRVAACYEKLLNDYLKKSPVSDTVDVDMDIPLGNIKRPYGVAVVIGNQRYEAEKKGLSDVKYAERDAMAVKEYLVRTMGYDPENIIYRTNVSFADMRNIFGTQENPEGMLHRYVRKGCSQVFIYYAGHGAPGPHGSANYLVPVDAAVDYIANNGYSLDAFYYILSKLPAKEVTVVLDACFSGYSAAGPLFKKISPGMLKSRQPVRKMAGGSVFCGADKDQVCAWYPAKRHSLFTYFFLKGLGGKADKNGDKAITTGEMKTYLEDEVPYWAGREANRKQNPLVTGDENAVLTRLK
ncbi:tetratricopeptide repeat protein [delta proteobacterium NaphS2]|nr:tetratricopeptide repeat protein [delta proteobacterium NaphS2]